MSKAKRSKAIVMTVIVMILISCNLKLEKGCIIPLGTRVKVNYINKEGTIVKRCCTDGTSWFYYVQYNNGVYDEQSLSCDRLTIITPNKNNR